MLLLPFRLPYCEHFSLSRLLWGGRLSIIHLEFVPSASLPPSPLTPQKVQARAPGQALPVQVRSQLPPQGKPCPCRSDPSSLLHPGRTQCSEPVLGAALVAQGWAGLLVPVWADGRGLPRTCARRVWTVRVPPQFSLQSLVTQRTRVSGDPCWL